MCGSAEVGVITGAVEPRAGPPNPAQGREKARGSVPGQPSLGSRLTDKRGLSSLRKQGWEESQAEGTARTKAGNLQTPLENYDELRVTGTQRLGKRGAVVGEAHGVTPWRASLQVHTLCGSAGLGAREGAW